MALDWEYDTKPTQTTNGLHFIDDIIRRDADGNVTQVGLRVVDVRADGAEVNERVIMSDPITVGGAAQSRADGVQTDIATVLDSQGKLLAGQQV